MSLLAVTSNLEQSDAPQNSPQSAKERLGLKVILAFLAIYVIWGSTFLAIRVAVLLVPPWLCAGIRFFIAGVMLFAFTQLRGEGWPTLREWRSLAILGVLMFSVTYGALFWGEQFVPSGITSVLEATLPLFTVLLEVFVLRQQRFRWRVMVAVVVGFCGVGLMMLTREHASFGVVPCLVIMGGSSSWSLGAVLTRSLRLPKSRMLTAGAEMMLGGGLLLVLSLAVGRAASFPGDSGAGGIGAGVSDYRGIADWVYGFCVAAGADAGEPGGEPCLCKSHGGDCAGVFCGWRADYGAYAAGSWVGAGERGADDANKIGCIEFGGPRKFESSGSTSTLTI